MYNATCKIIIASILLSLIGCANNHDLAQNLYNEAASAIESKNYDKAICLIDSINTSYKEQTQVRRNALHLLAKATEGKTLREIEQNDSLITILQVEYNSMTPVFMEINDPKLVEGYIIAKKANRPILEESGLQARITPNGEFYVISSHIGNIKHTSVSLICGKEQATSATVKYDGDKNYRSANTEMITFLMNECDTLGAFMQKHIGQHVSLRFNGNKSKTYKMNATDIEAFGLTYKYATIIAKLKSSLRRKEMLDQKLLLARDQIARTINNNIIEQEE